MTEASAPDLIDRALRFARWAYCASDDRGLEHPWDVAALLAMCGFDDTVIAAGLLHDVVEDTAVSVRDLETSVGREVAEIVQVVSENAGLPSYEDRKADLRQRVAEAGGAAAAVFAADKLARLRLLHQTGRAVPDEKLDHYIKSLVMLAELDDAGPFVRAIADELASQEVTASSTASGGPA
jgi:(p)ppGpp synthase/HD superfamily hydrolase